MAEHLELITPRHDSPITTIPTSTLQPLSLPTRHPQEPDATLAQPVSNFIHLRSRNRQKTTKSNVEHRIRRLSIQPIKIIGLLRSLGCTSLERQVRYRRPKRVHRKRKLSLHSFNRERLGGMNGGEEEVLRLTDSRHGGEDKVDETLISHVDDRREVSETNRLNSRDVINSVVSSFRQVDGMVAVAYDEVKIVEDGEDGGRHGPEGSKGDVAVVGEVNGPAEAGVGDDEVDGVGEVVEEVGEGLEHFGLGGGDEGGHVGGAVELGREDVGDGGEVDAGWGRGEEGDPFLGEDEGDLEMVTVEGGGGGGGGIVGVEEEGAEVEHGVDVAAPWVRDGHHVA